MRDGWEYKKLGDVCRITMGQSPDGNSINESDGTEFHQGKTCFGDRFLGVSPYYCNKPTKLADAHSVLLCVRAPVGYPNITERQICIGRGLCCLNPNSVLDNHYLFYVLLNQQDYFEKNATGSTFKAISSKIVANAYIPIPPLSTQLSIVSELDKINELIRLKKDQLSDYDKLAQSLFYEMFGDPVENEKGWEVKKLGEFSEVVRGGSPRPIDNYLGGDYPWIKIGDATKGNGIYLESTKEYIIKEGLNKTRYIPQGSMIFANCGVSLGFARIITFAGCIHDGWLAFMNIDEDIVNKIFFLKSLNVCTPYFRSLAPEGTQPNLNTKIMRCFHQILPPLPLQQLFAQRIELIEQQKAEIKNTIADLETLLASRMQYWFD